MTDPFVSDPDFQHLARLLAMLPGRDDAAFWATVNNGAQRIYSTGDPEIPDTEYILSKMQNAVTNLRKAEYPAFVAYSGHYLLNFFDGDRPALWAYLDKQFAAHGGSAATGERFTRDLCATAWRIIAKYDPQGDNDLAERWPGHRG